MGLIMFLILQVLLHAIENTKNRKERNTLAAQVAFIRNPHSDSLADIERLVITSKESNDPLLLSYGALASQLSGDAKQQIVKFLLNFHSIENNNTTLVHLIHALGNTESSEIGNFIINYLSHSDPNIQLAAVYALRYIMDSTIQSEFIHILESKNSSCFFAEAVIRALIAEAEWKSSRKVQPISTKLFKALVNATSDNKILVQMLLHYTTLIEEIPREWLAILKQNIHKRGTTIWNSADQIYNLVLSRSDRDYDMEAYPCNKAYLWAKSIGLKVLRLEGAFGSFAGFGCSTQHPTNYKLFARGLVRGYAFKFSKTAIEALLLSEKKPGSQMIENRVYFSIVGKVLADKCSDIPTCKTCNFPLYSSPDYTLLKISVPIFIYVGYLTFSLELKTRLGIDASLGACITDCVSVKGSLEPSAALIASAQTSATIIVSLHCINSVAL